MLHKKEVDNTYESRVIYERKVVLMSRLDENELIEEIRAIQKLKGFKGFRSIKVDPDSFPTLTYYIQCKK